MFRASLNTAIAAIAILAAAPVHADPDEAPLNYFLHAHGPAARPTLVLDWVFTAITLLVCIIIAGLLVAAIIRKRLPAEDSALGREEGGLRWIAIGTSLSVCALLFMATYALITLNQSATPLTSPRLTIAVTGYDWWWKVEYRKPDGSADFVTANEIHIPTGEPVRVLLKSADVIHAFWVPQLAGKTEMIPGMINQQWLQADDRGVYYGKCTQFCGIQHAHMDFEVVADNPADFEQWQKTQRAPSTSRPTEGGRIFMNRCGACHAIEGTEAKGQHGPDLTHLLSRRLIAAGLMTNNPEHLIDWVQHAQELKPGAQMPDMELSPAEASQLSAYLATLK